MKQPPFYVKKVFLFEKCIFEGGGVRVRREGVVLPCSSLPPPPNSRKLSDSVIFFSGKFCCFFLSGCNLADYLQKSEDKLLRRRERKGGGGGSIA